MGKIIFVLGGVRSGKSQFAVKLASQNNKKVAFIATCVPNDIEMRKRIELHKKSRPKNWVIFENQKDITLLLKEIGSKFDIIILDCLTLLVSNFMFLGLTQADIENKINELLGAIKETKARLIIVSNEVGLGIVPNNKLGRDFRDIAGCVNQIVANDAEKVFFLVSGIPWRIK